MDPVKLHNMAEQRCKKYGCAVAVSLSSHFFPFSYFFSNIKRCMKQAQEPAKCLELFKILTECIKTEKDLILNPPKTS